jgi:hypothetical protein
MWLYTSTPSYVFMAWCLITTLPYYLLEHDAMSPDTYLPLASACSQLRQLILHITPNRRLTSTWLNNVTFQKEILSSRRRDNLRSQI